MRALDNVFHLKCFICVVCGVRLQKGDQYVIKQSQLFCRPDYEKEVEMFQYNYGNLKKLKTVTNINSIHLKMIIAVKTFIIHGLMDVVDLKDLEQY